jgi:NTE family protein
MTGAVVFSGGGLAGIAWEIGILAGISDASPRAFAAITDPSVLYVGTSAGSAVASQLAGGAPIEELFAAQVAEESAELGADFDADSFTQTMNALMEGVTTAEEARRRIGRFALDAETPAGEDRRAVIAARLTTSEWPDRRLMITAVNAETGELRVFDRESGVPLLDAVTASCAVPGVWPTVLIEGQRYTDGGVRSISNADLAAGSDPVLILTPSPPDGPAGPVISEAQLAPLGGVTAVYADEASLRSFGANPLDPAVRPPAAWAGREQGRLLAAGLEGWA